MNSSAGFLNTSHNMTSDTGKSRIMNQNLLPCTVASILALDSTRENLMVGDIEIHQITIVGKIKSVKESPTIITYDVDDMSGPTIEVKKWMETKDSSDDFGGNSLSDKNVVYPENSYIRVFGTIRSFNGKKSVLAFKILPITDMNELTLHMLEITYANAKLKAMSDHNIYNDNNTFNSRQPFNDVSNNGIDSNLMEDSMINNTFTQGYSGLKPLAIQIIKVISMNRTEEGASLHDIKRQMPNVPIDNIRKELEFLNNEGHIFNTIDEDHYKSIDNC